MAAPLVRIALLSTATVVLLSACDRGDASTSTGGEQESTIAMAPQADQGDLEAELVLNRQVFLGRTEALATTDFRGWRYEPTPQDTRPSFATDTPGERCTTESNSQFPWSYAGQSWPSGPFSNLGNLTVAIDGAPGPIVLETNLDREYGAFYWTTDQPPHLRAGGTRLPFISADYLPVGRGLHLRVAGGPNAGAQAFDPALVIPDAPVLLEPDVEHTAEIRLAEHVTIRWARSAAPGTDIELAFPYIFNGGTALVQCLLEDDGEVTLPGGPLSFLTAGVGSAGLYISRRARTTVIGTEVGGGRLFLHVIARSDRLGPVRYTRP